MKHAHWKIHCVAWCTGCNKKWEDYTTAGKQAYAHANQTGHIVMGETGFAFKYNWPLNKIVISLWLNRPLKSQSVWKILKIPRLALRKDFGRFPNTSGYFFYIAVQIPATASSDYIDSETKGNDWSITQSCKPRLWSTNYQLGQVITKDVQEYVFTVTSYVYFSVSFSKAKLCPKGNITVKGLNWQKYKFLISIWLV